MPEPPVGTIKNPLANEGLKGFCAVVISSWIHRTCKKCYEHRPECPYRTKFYCSSLRQLSSPAIPLFGFGAISCFAHLPLSISITANYKQRDLS